MNIGRSRCNNIGAWSKQQCDELQVMFSNRPSLCLFTIHRQGLATNTPLAAVKEKNLNSNKTHFIVLFRFIVLLYYIWYSGGRGRIQFLQFNKNQVRQLLVRKESLYQIMSDYKLCLMGVYLWQLLFLHYLNFSKAGRCLILTAFSRRSTWISIWSKSNPQSIK